VSPNDDVDAHAFLHHACSGTDLLPYIASPSSTG